MSLNDNFALVWHSDTKVMISEAQNKEVFFERVKHAKYYMIRNNQNDCYFSVNSFITKMLKCNIFELVGLAVNVDFGSEVNEEYVVRLLEDQEFDFNIPRPSYINFSGNGLHIYWKYEKPIPARNKANQIKQKLIFLHDKINSAFVKILLDYGADQQAINITRLLRDTNTFNTKYHEKKIVYNIRYYTINYSIKELQRWLSKLEQKKKKLNKALSNQLNGRNCNTLHMARLQDILKLAELRSYEFLGNMELMCFLVRYYTYITSGDNERAK